MLKRIFFALTMTALVLTLAAPLTFAFFPCEPGELPETLPDGSKTCGPGSGTNPGGGGGNNIEPELPDNPATNFGSGSNLIGDFVTKILPIAIGIGGFLTVIFIAISGVQFITSSGNPEAAAAARSRLTFAIIGFVILALSFVIVKLIDNIFLGTGIFG